MSTSLLTQVRSIAKKAAKSGSGWTGKSGAITCKDGRCTLAAIMYKQTEPMLKLQEEYNDLIERASAMGNGRVNVNAGYDDLFSDLIEVDNFVDAGSACEALGIDDELAELVITANDSCRRDLEATVKRLRAEHEANKAWGYTDPLSENDEYQEAVRNLKARVILEEELFGKRK